MRLENSFEVDAPVDRVWSYLLDVEKVTPCMPGASITERVDDDNFKGKVTVKLGPVSLTYAGKVAFVERDEAARRVVMKGQGTEQRGKGAASATITSTLHDHDGKTKVDIVQELNVQGQAAQFGRGMMQDVSARLTRQFAECLQKNMGAEQAARAPASAAGGGSSPAPAPAVQTTSKPIQGIRLAWFALKAAIVRGFKRLFGRRH
jgi:carbon monoxide dehydrogenase subunit G